VWIGKVVIDASRIGQVVGRPLRYGLPVNAVSRWDFANEDKGLRFCFDLHRLSLEAANMGENKTPRADYLDGEYKVTWLCHSWGF
jgi:hypothetical protein